MWPAGPQPAERGAHSGDSWRGHRTGAGRLVRKRQGWGPERALIRRGQTPGRSGTAEGWGTGAWLTAWGSPLLEKRRGLGSESVPCWPAPTPAGSFPAWAPLCLFGTDAHCHQRSCTRRLRGGVGSGEPCGREGAVWGGGERALSQRRGSSQGSPGGGPSQESGRRGGFYPKRYRRWRAITMPRITQQMTMHDLLLHREARRSLRERKGAGRRLSLLQAEL